MEDLSSTSVRTGELERAGHRTWFRITGEETATPGRDPVVILHGGPGLAHNACLKMADLAADGRLVVHYDQLGCGRSTHLPNVDPSFWTIDLFIDELTGLVRSLGFERFHLVGHSWGGMLGVEYALAHPQGIASLTICNSPATMDLWVQAADELLQALPTQTQEVLRTNEAAGTTGSPEYLAATLEVYEKHFCRVVPRPDEVTASLAQMEDDPSVYHAMNGPSEFYVVGSLKDWTVVDRVSDLSVPTLVVAGRYDEATPATWAPFVEQIPDVRSHVFSESSHTPHIEEPQAWRAVVGAFLREHDGRTDAEVAHAAARSSGPTDTSCAVLSGDRPDHDQAMPPRNTTERL